LLLVLVLALLLLLLLLLGYLMRLVLRALGVMTDSLAVVVAQTLTHACRRRRRH
jgi:hypothetical protein